MTRREELEAALAMAQAVLADAVFIAANGDGNQAEANADLERARAHCREIRAALVKLDRSESMAPPVNQSSEAAEGVVAPSPPSTQSGEHSVRGRGRATRNKSRKRNPVHRLQVGASARKPRPGYTPARSVLVRQTVGLLALILAYLFYFQMGVELQIQRLPTLIPLSEERIPTRTHYRLQSHKRIHR